MSDYAISHVDCLAALAGALEELRQAGYTEPKIYSVSSGAHIPDELLPKLVPHADAFDRDGFVVLAKR